VEIFNHPNFLLFIGLIVADQGRSEARFTIKNDFLCQVMFSCQIFRSKRGIEETDHGGRHRKREQKDVDNENRTDEQTIM
jgi:hypothetical protein